MQRKEKSLVIKGKIFDLVDVSRLSHGIYDMH
jgi:hypothetical protein